MTTRAIAMATDALVLILTWTNTYGWKFDREHLHHVQQITELIIQNGMVYFTALLVLNIVALIFDVNDERLPATQFTIINSVLTNVLICRFILDLRDASFTPDDLSQISSVRFVGNIGAPLDVQHCSVPPGGEDWDAGELDVEEVLSVGPSRALEDCETKSEV
ncbi:hypothetical protein BXZ70DRAFT_453385 [Cristinia sonorae]|uniref:Uncharacterized protein n=1 Tax=Cristinia sonorae TaxID=1940300 RepID=A0A8K0XMS8_9AGAR|nr:hypothetical protein BXZ70DRAFT_453385 [Cristinia sonorae]